MFLYVLLSAGQAWPIWAYTGIKFAHHLIYYTGQRHEVRATAWTLYNSSYLYMCYKVGEVVIPLALQQMQE